MDANQEANETKNVGKIERIASVAGGGALMIYGLTQRSWVAKASGLTSGGALLYRGLSGHCHAKAALQAKGAADVEMSSAMATSRPEIKATAPGHGGILVTRSVTINASPETLYSFWRDFENLPRLMRHLESVEVLDEKRSKWTAKAPLGQSVSWEAEIVRDEPNQLIAWQSAPDATVANSGSVRFVAAPAGRGTELKVTLEYKPPGGALGALFAKLWGEEPQQQVEDDLRRFKSLIEAGEIPTIEGQPSGRK